MLWFFGLVFLGFMAPCVYVYLRVPMPGTTREWILLPAAFFGLLGFALLAAAACGVWSKQSLRIGLKSGDESVEPEGAKPADAQAALARLEASPPGTGAPLPYFHARGAPAKSDGGVMLYRVYPAEGEFLFIGLGVSTLDRERQARAAGGTIGAAGLVPGLIKGFNVYMHSMNLERHQALLRALERVNDLNPLRRFAEEDPMSFTLAQEGVRDLSIDPPSIWDELAHHGDIAAKLRFIHPGRGKMAFDLPSFADVSGAVKELSQRFGDAVQVRVG
jgi:hypothetical protein